MGLLDQIQSSLGRLATGAMSRWLGEHREELIVMLETAQVERARGLLFSVCEEFPAAAGIVTMLMRGTPQQALSNIAIYDPDLAARLSDHIGTFEKLQAAWRDGATA